MTKEDKSQIKTFVDRKHLFELVENYVLNLPKPEYDGQDLADYGALVVAHDKMREQLKGRFDGLKIIAQNVVD